MSRIRSTLLLAGLCLLHSVVHGETADERESRLFSDDVFFQEEEVKPPSGDYRSLEDELFTDEPFADQGTDEKESIIDLFSSQLDFRDRQFEIGGRYIHSNTVLNTPGESAGESAFTSNGIVDLYFDGRMDDDIRFFYQQKIGHSFDGNDDFLILLLSQLRDDSSVDQLWLKFHLNNKIFFTLGKQPTKWGAGMVWQPTDFLNDTKFNPLDLVDQRLGVSLVKMEIPMPEWGLNVNTVLQLNDVDTLQDLGLLLRFEQLRENAEYALTFAAKDNSALKFGFDFSKGLSLVDLQLGLALIHDDQSLYYEGAFALEEGILTGPSIVDRSNEWIPQLSTGILYSRTVGDDHTLILNGEVFYNDQGYEEEAILPFVLFTSLFQRQGGFSPLYFSRKYMALGATLTGLGPNRDRTYNSALIGSISDGTGVWQNTLTTTPFRDLSVAYSMGWFFGGEGAFRPNVDFLNVDEILNGLPLKPPRFNLEIQFRVQF